MNSNPSQDAGPVFPPENQQYDTMNSKIMLSAVVSLSLVILVVLILHLYARCAMSTESQSRRRQGGASVHHLPFQFGPRLVDEPKTGLDPSVIASLPLFIIKDNLDGDCQRSEDTSVFDCPVCLSGLEAGEAARLLPNCKHSFHVECIDTWLTGQSTCPICRTEVAPWRIDGETTIAPMMEGEGASESSGGSIQGSSVKEGGSSSSRLSSFRRMISRDWSSSRRIQPFEQDVVQDLERQ